MTKSSTGLEENVAAFLAYIVGPITGVLFIVLEKKSKFVKFHAFQSLFFSLGALIVTYVLGRIPVVGWVLETPVGILFLLVWIYCLVKSIQGKKFKLPIVGGMAEKYAK